MVRFDHTGRRIEKASQISSSFGSCAADELGIDMACILTMTRKMNRTLIKHASAPVVSQSRSLNSTQANGVYIVFAPESKISEARRDLQYGRCH